MSATRGQRKTLPRKTNSIESLNAGDSCQAKVVSTKHYPRCWTGSSKFMWTIKVVPKPSDRARCSFSPSSHPGGVEVFWPESGNKNEVMGRWFQRTNETVWGGWRAGKLSTVMYPHGKSYAEVRVKRFFPRPQSGMEATISVVSLAWRGNSGLLWLKCLYVRVTFCSAENLDRYITFSQALRDR